MQHAHQSLLARNPQASQIVLEAQCSEWKKTRIRSLEARIQRVKRQIEISEDSHNDARYKNLNGLNAQLTLLTGRPCF